MTTGHVTGMLEKLAGHPEFAGRADYHTCAALPDYSSHSYSTTGFDSRFPKFLSLWPIIVSKPKG
jgi:hypothetical protein